MYSAPGQMLAGAAIGAVAGFLLSIARDDRMERGWALLGAGLGAALLAALGSTSW